MDNLPINSPEIFGDADQHDTAIGTTVLSLVDDAPAPNPARPRPAVKRLLQGDGANFIVFNFCPGQDLPDHKAAHPITVQCISGELDFECDGKRIPMKPGEIYHLRAYVPHAVYCPDQAPEENNILLLTMLTGERHQ
ncbi:cupin domain-containing protein [Corynebacterium breve]|uniref:Cupin domain-containing protein n=1 Tax=Corynebacterium breve TaxID=3049799 RepID=A0ABY8VCR0_9CORY|nr:cupin domain-containing protein [Corynebacterium breve]WIM66902.1 cupin domain-containing protein [Corynebacterium breve]